MSTMNSPASSGRSVSHGSPVSAKGTKLKGHPVQVVVAKDDQSFELDEEELSSILLHPNVRDKKVVVLSVAGAFRKGKSFFLDFCLRYLNAQNSPDWLGDDDSPLEGFPWRGETDGCTSGILLWSEPFVTTLSKTGEEVAILLMDTQGSFDTQSTIKNCATIFALSQLLSSVQVFNIAMNIQEDNLQHLQLFTEFGRLSMDETNSIPFQDLYFLVRDWQYPYEHPYGELGGQELIDKRLRIVDGQHSELEKLRKHIRSCFRKIGCYLMPHPGLKVATNPYFDGRLTDVTEDFKQHLRMLIPLLLSKENLIIKEINGTKITCRELYEYFKAYTKIYQSDKVPKPKTMLLATAEANNLSAVSNAMEFYTREMDQICGADGPYVSQELLLSQHIRFRDGALKMFDTCKKMGGEGFSETFRSRLEEDIMKKYDLLIKQNESKNVFAAAKTPAVLFFVIVALYFVAGVFAVFGMTSLANLSNLLMMILMSLLGLWTYARYTGNLTECEECIDVVASNLWENFIGPHWKQLMQGGTTKLVEHSLGNNFNKKIS